MRKNKLTTVSILLLSLLLSGCNSTADSELDEIIKNLPAAQISDGKIDFDPVSEADNNTPFSSVTGNVVSASSKELTVKCDGKEYKFTIDEDTKILGGAINESEAVTITYEGDLSDKKTIAKIITVLFGDGKDNYSEAPPVTDDEPDETTDTQTSSESSTTHQDITESTAEEMTSAPETAVADETEAPSSDTSA